LLTIFVFGIYALLVLPQIVTISFGDEEEVNIDETVTATCTITKGDLPLIVWWTFSDLYDNNLNLTTNDGVEILRRGQKVSMLSIEAVKARHRGNYTCHAQNKAGTASQSAYLAINGDSKIQTIKKASNLQFVFDLIVSFLIFKFFPKSFRILLVRTK
jgi:hypothetical protein